MASETLPVFPASEFPQNLNSHVHPIFQQLLNNLVAHEIRRVERG